MMGLGKIDTVTKDYIRNPVIFADLFNKFIYHGKQVIRPESLAEMDTAEIVVPYGEGGAGVPEQKYRDMLKLVMTDGNAAYCILGCEGESSVNYAMPVKTMTYDAMQFARQVTRAAKSHRKKKGNKPSSGEFLGGFHKTDRLIPVLTLVVHWGPDRWDGPLSLKEMYAAADDAIMQYVPDYRINLIAPGQMADDEIREFKTSLKEVMLYIKYSKDKNKLQEVTQSDPDFQSLDRQAAEVINVTTNSKLKYPEGKETVNMCAALEEIRLDSKREGKIEGTVETCKNFNMPFPETVRYLSDHYALSLQQAEEEAKKYWK